MPKVITNLLQIQRGRKTLLNQLNTSPFLIRDTDSESPIAIPIINEVFYDIPGQNQLSQGETYNIVIIGTNFTGTTSISLGAGITIDSIDGIDNEQINATITVQLTATLGNRTASVTNPSGTGTLPDAVEIVFGFGNALKADGVNDYVTLTNWGTSTSNLTISLWLKLEKNNGADFQAILSSTAGEFIHFNLFNGIINSYIYGPNSSIIGTTSFYGANLNTWHHVALTYELGTARLYIDGVLEKTQAMGASAITAPISNYNMFRGAGGGRILGGQLDEVAIWRNHTASLAEIQLLASGKLASDIIPNPNQYYQLNGVSGDTIALNIGSDIGNGNLVNFNTATCWVAH